MRTQTITAFFADLTAAERAVEALKATGAAPDSILLIEPEEDGRSPAEAWRRGGYMVSVRVETPDRDRIADILHCGGSLATGRSEVETEADRQARFDPAE